MLPVIEGILRGLPYGKDNAMVEAIMTSIRQQGRVERTAQLASIKVEISDLIERATDIPDLQVRILKVREIIRREGNATDLQMLLYMKLAEKYQELTAGK